MTSQRAKAIALKHPVEPAATTAQGFHRSNLRSGLSERVFFVESA
jgi:hypothetical protein